MISTVTLGNVKRFFDELPLVAAKAASIAINEVANRSGLAIMRKDIETQIAYPSGYLNSADKLGVTKRASPTSLQAVITAKDRPTSLARFATNRTPERNRGNPVTVQVKRGKRLQLKKVFLVRLKSGNVGLAVRLKPGETLNNKTQASTVKLGPNVYLLYAPSVEQVFSNVAEARVPEISNLVSNQFFRQFARLSNG